MIKNAKFELLAFQHSQAYDIVSKTWGETIEESASNKIISFCTHRGRSDQKVSYLPETLIEPALLSAICTYIEQERVEKGKSKIDLEFIKNCNRYTVLCAVYHNILFATVPETLRYQLNKSNFKDYTSDVRQFLAIELINTEHLKKQYFIDHNTSNEIKYFISILENLYFIRRKDTYIELTNDVFIPIILQDFGNGTNPHKTSGHQSHHVHNKSEVVHHDVNNKESFILPVSYPENDNLVPVIINEDNNAKPIYAPASTRSNLIWGSIVSLLLLLLLLQFNGCILPARMDGQYKRDTIKIYSANLIHDTVSNTSASIKVHDTMTLDKIKYIYNPYRVPYRVPYPIPYPTGHDSHSTDTIRILVCKLGLTQKEVRSEKGRADVEHERARAAEIALNNCAKMKRYSIDLNAIDTIK